MLLVYVLLLIIVAFVVVKDEVAVEMPVADINTIPNHIDDVFVDVVVAVAGV